MNSPLFTQALQKTAQHNAESSIHCTTAAEAITLVNSAKPQLNALGTVLTIPLTEKSQAGMIFLVGLNADTKMYVPNPTGVREDEASATITVAGAENIQALKELGLLFPGRFMHKPSTAGMQR